jgi:hypothetical protein
MGVVSHKRKTFVTLHSHIFYSSNTQQIEMPMQINRSNLQIICWWETPIRGGSRRAFWSISV